MAAHYSERNVKELLALWDQYHEEYCGIVAKYWSLIEEKKRLRLRLDIVISKNEIRDEFPEIAFLRAKSKEDAIYQLDKMSENDVRYLTNIIKSLVNNESSIFNRLKKAIRNSDIQIKRAKKPKTYAFSRKL